LPGSVKWLVSIHVLPHKYSPIPMAMITGKIHRHLQQLYVNPSGLQSLRGDQLFEYDAVAPALSLSERVKQHAGQTSARTVSMR
jgi:hypothetical protein